MLQIVIVCTGNTCRSPMAEVLLNNKIKEQRLDKQIIVSSAGVAVWSEGCASAGALEAMKLRGLDAKSHRSRRLLLENVVKADLLLTMTENHKAAVLDLMPEAQDKVYTLAEFAGDNGEISDPYGGNLVIYESCAAQIEKMLEKSWGKIVDLAGKKDCVEKNDN